MKNAVWALVLTQYVGQGTETDILGVFTSRKKAKKAAQTTCKLPLTWATYRDSEIIFNVPMDDAPFGFTIEPYDLNTPIVGYTLGVDTETKKPNANDLLIEFDPLNLDRLSSIFGMPHDLDVSNK